MLCYIFDIFWEIFFYYFLEYYYLYVIGLLLLPIFSICYLSLISSNKIYFLRKVSLFCSIFIFLYSLVLYYPFYKGVSGFKFTIFFSWWVNFNLELHFGVDGISVFFIFLSTFLIPICILCSWESIFIRLKEFFILLFFIEFLLVCVFVILDLLLFYIFFEAILIPMFLIIGVWGSRERKVHAAYMFFFYTLFGSLLMLLAILYIYNSLGSTDIEVLWNNMFSNDIQLLLWLCFFISLAVKIPMVPFHLWLPEAHVEAPTAGSVLLAGILLKLGGYGVLRFMLPVFPYANLYFKPLVFSMSVLGIIYTSFTTLRQIDLKKIIAYSSVAHMNYVMMGLFSNTIEGIEGAIYLMLCHGIVSSALFLCIGFLYERYGSRLLFYYGGLVQFMPIFCSVFLFFILSNMSLPGTCSFIGELLILIGLFEINPFICFLSGIGLILGGVYSIWLYNRVCFGELKKNFIYGWADLNSREFVIFIPFIFLNLFMGIYSNVFLEIIHLDVILILEKIIN